MIKPISFSGLRLDRIGNVDVLGKVAKNEESLGAYARACAEINKLSGNKDVFIKTSYPNEEDKSVAKFEIADEEDNTIAEVTTPIHEFTPTIFKIGMEKLVDRFDVSR